VVGKAACSGDSGSPLVSKETGAIIGTLSYLTNVDPEKNELVNIAEPVPWCDDGLASVYHTLEGRPFIEQAFAEAGHKLWLEGEPEPLAFGQGCASADQCDSGICAGPPGATICSQACDTGGCPEGLRCASIDGKQVCTSGEPSAGGSGGSPDPGGSGGTVSPGPNPADNGGDDGCQAAVGATSRGAALWGMVGLALGLFRRRLARPRASVAPRASSG
jgi:hypothetical protein